MSIITAKGKDARKSAETKKVDLKNVFLKLKDGDSIKVRLLSAEDYVEYKAHGDFNLGIYTQPCIAPEGKKCALCEASKSGIEEFERIYAKKRYLFAFSDLKSGELRVFDASKNQATSLIAEIEELASDYDFSEAVFTFSRKGTKTATAYSLKVVPEKKVTDEDRVSFEKFDGQEVEVSFYEAVLQARDYEGQVKSLKDAGFPVAQFFDVMISDSAAEDNGTPIDTEDEDISVI
ncbi:MAG: hypothetical protein K0S71_311 [Clostridia bacterium]|jgi:hypothetical protein|nr:hypothetical protein [Clostridia bacterium]